MTVDIAEKGSEEWYMLRDEFVRYIENEVNPARLAHGLSEIREHEARECYRILDDFWRDAYKPRTK